MFKNKADQSTKISVSPFQKIKQLEQERDELVLKILEIRASHPAVFEDCNSTPQILFALVKAPGHTYHNIVTTPYLPFEILQRLLGLIWISGCAMAMAISAAAAGGFWFSLLSLVALCISIFTVILFCLVYLDAGDPVKPEELIIEPLLPTAQMQRPQEQDTFRILLEKYRKNRELQLLTHR